MFVLDSFALLAWLQDETCALRIDQIFREAAAGETDLHLCVLNYGEVLTIIERRHGPEQAGKVMSIIDALPLKVVDVQRTLTFAAAHIKATYSISYADAFTVALAQQQDATILTGDPEFESVSELVAIEWLSTD